MERVSETKSYSPEYSKEMSISTSISPHNNLVYSLESDSSVIETREKTLIQSITKNLLRWGVESRGILPVPFEERTDRQFYKLFFIWFSANFNILTISTGTAGPLIFGLGLRDSCLTILFFNLLCCIPVSYLSTWGSKLGLRQMCQLRYSFGYYGAVIPSVLNLLMLIGFMTLDSIVGGQTLASVTDGRLSWTVGIVVIVVISLLVSFCGYRVIAWYERTSWIPVLVVCLVTVGLAGKNMIDSPTSEPASAKNILSFASTLAGFVLTYAGLASDFTTYLDPTAKYSSSRIFWYSYVAFVVVLVALECLGAALAVAASTNPAWSNALSTSLGNLFFTILSPLNGFGKFLTVILSLSVSGNIAPLMYSFGMSLQVSAPFFLRIPRYIFAVVATAITIPLSIAGAHRFYVALTNFLSIIAYYICNIISIIIVEHLVFRRPKRTNHGVLPSRAFGIEAFSQYDLTTWNSSKQLAPGFAAMLASLLSYAVVIPCMNQVWFTGPIGKITGDIGFEMALAVTAVLYLPLRFFEKKMFRR